MRVRRTPGGAPHGRSGRLSTGGAYAVLLAGLAVVALAWWLAHGTPTTDSGSSAATATAGGSTAGGNTAASPAASTTGSVSGSTPGAPANSSPGDLPATAVPATAHWVIDGDTLDIDVTTPEGTTTTHRLRLLNIDAPELAHPGQPLQCQAQAATAALVALAPKGTTLRVVMLGQDHYGRDLGEAWLADGRMLGVEIARAGLAAPITIADHAEFRALVDAARDEAAAAHRGLHDPAVSCSLPGKVSALESRLAGIPGPAAQPGQPGIPEVTPSAGPAAATLEADATKVLDDLTSRTPRAGVEALTAATRADLTARARAVVAAAHQLR